MITKKKPAKPARKATTARGRLTKPAKAPARKPAGSSKAVPKRAPSAGSGTAQLVKAQLVRGDGPPNLLTPEVRQLIREAGQVVVKIPSLSTRELQANISRYVSDAENHAGMARSAGSLALVCAWISGKLLNAAKDKLAHGEFGPWLKTMAVNERTAQRYMKLATVYVEAADLVQWQSLRQAYIAAGILPSLEITSGDGQESRAADQLVMRLSGLLRSLAHFKQVGKRLAAAERKQLQKVREELEQLFDELLG